MRDVEVDNRIRAAYRQLAQSPARNAVMHSWVFLSALRPKLAGIPRTDVDRVLVRMGRSDYDGPGAVSLAPIENRGAITAADRAAAVRIGSFDQHVIQFQNPVPRAAGPTAQERAEFRDALGRARSRAKSAAGLARDLGVPRSTLAGWLNGAWPRSDASRIRILGLGRR